MDPLVDVAARLPTAAQFERYALEILQRDVGYDVAFAGLRGEPMTSVGLPPEWVERAVRPGSEYARALAPLKRAALAARGVAIDTDVLGESYVRQTPYYRDFARPLGGKYSLFGYFVLRGQVIGAVMLGRTGGAFRPDDVARVADVLPALTVARASYGPPGLARGPLPQASPHHWPWGARELARRTTARAEIRVRDVNGFREMTARDRASGRAMIWTRAGLDDAARSGWPYIDLLHVAASLAHRRQRALFIGCGGAIGPRQFAVCYPGIAIDVVERERDVVDLARAFYGLDEIPHTTVHVADAAAFFGAARESWDVIVVDAYDADALDESVCERRYFESLRALLSPGGAFAVNVVSRLDGTGAVHAVVRAAGGVFGDVRLVPVMTPGEKYDASATRNVVVIGARC